MTRPGLIIGVATLLGCFSAFQAFQAITVFSDKPAPFWVLLGLNLGYWYAWAILAPIVIWLARRFPFERSVWQRSVPVHLLAVLVVTFAHVAMSEWTRTAVMAWTGRLSEMRYPWWERVQRMFLENFDWEMMTYWAIVACVHALTYYRESQERALKASQLETRLAEAQLQALQRQLHPHFLFNTLNTISALMHRDVQAADRMLVKLSDLLRLALDQRGGAQEVRLAEELEFVETYLEIERARFGPRLSVRFDVEPETLDALVPNFVLQPLVENSVRHAVAVRVEPGVIDIGARRRGDRLELEVRDNGPGLPKGVLCETAGRGVGLATTRLRLEHLYGAAQELRLADAPGGGVVATVTVPFRADGAGEVDGAGEAGEVDGASGSSRADDEATAERGVA